MFGPPVDVVSRAVEPFGTCQCGRFGIVDADRIVEAGQREDLAVVLTQAERLESLALALHAHENAWLLGLAGAREQRLLTQGVMGLVGARGIAPSCLTLARWSDS